MRMISKGKVTKRSVGIVFLLALFLVIIGSCSYAATESAIDIEIDGKPVFFDTNTGFPFIDENSRTQVPFRATMETFGAEVSWNSISKTAIAKLGDITVEVPVGEDYIIKNNIRIDNDTKARVKDGRTYLPIRAVLKAFGAYVNWDPNAKRVIATTNNTKNPVVTMEMSTGEKIVIMLYPEIAPNTVLNFIHLSDSGFYDGLIFHRVIKGFMIQGGDPLGTGAGGPGYRIAGEFDSNGFENNLSHTEGVISMARSTSFDSAGSQFFIVHQNAAFLDGEYAAFGKVVEGYEVVNQLAGVATNSKDKPVTDLVMKKISVETFGVSYPDPTVIK